MVVESDSKFITESINNGQVSLNLTTQINSLLMDVSPGEQNESKAMRYTVKNH